MKAGGLGALDAVRSGASLQGDGHGDGAAGPVPVLPALRPVIPGGGLRRGSVVGIEGGAGDGSLGLALAAGASRGGWCAVVGMPDFGVLAAAGMGAEPARLLLVDEPRDRWPDVVAALIEAVDLVLVRPPRRPAAAAVRRLTALARRHGGVLAIAPPADDWPGSLLRLRVEEAEWTGLGAGHGHLRARRALVAAAARGAAGPGPRAWLWLPGPDGTVAAAEPAAGTERPDLAGRPDRPALEVVA